ncbi:GNAT family N-acetyltransferase [bacterium SCSIO 12696]|uniref:GNAT family N-acetyltransferase n=1 Tax=Porticoccus sp. W117 TaxID=3054777 RepID=UPI0021F94DDD|nr:GNAT family protein [Porticoccus sp. W117]MDM3872387.1 GNAT family protein [Porticoccus sp. W117]UTW46032.1 GNAT family N-acetyltransferase [bacterium SCSIO 12696]
MDSRELLESQRLIFRELNVGDVTQEYVDWLNDPEINQYLETRFMIQDIKSVKCFVESMLKSSENILFGVFEKQSGKHIGNIKLGPISLQHSRATIGLMVGEKTCWGRGYATEMIKAVSKYAFISLGLNKVDAGCYEENLGSKKAFLKSGYQVEGVLREHAQVDGRRQDCFVMGLLKSESADG